MLGAVLVTLVGSALVPVEAAGQLGFLSGFFREVSHVGAHVGCWNVRTRGITETQGCDIGEGFGFRLTRRVIVIEEQVITDIFPMTGWTVVGGDTTYHYTAAKDTSRTLPRLDIEFEMGYSQFSGFVAENDQVKLLGSIWEIPSLAAYGRVNHGWQEPIQNRFWDFLNPIEFQVGIGVHSGLIALNDFRAQLRVPGVDDPGNPPIASTQAFNGSAKTFQFGGSLSAGVMVGRLYLGYELLKVARSMDVKWDGRSDVRAIPDLLPKEFDLGGWSGSVVAKVRVSSR